MKKLFVIILFVGATISAQNKEFKYNLTGIKKVVLSSNTTIKLEVGTTNQFIISETKSKKDKDNVHWSIRSDREKRKQNKEDKRKGLTAVYPGGKDNTKGFGFSIYKEDGVLYVNDLKSHFQRRGLSMKLPKTMNVSLDSGNLGSIYVEGFTGEVEASSNIGKVEMKNVTGPITIDANVAKVDIDFDVVSQKSPITISSSVSEIDIALPANTKADLELRTQGTVYTDFDFEIPKKKGLKNVSGRKSIVSKLNGGGVKIYIKSSMGNIYLRKK
ncbi:hypothetical protein [Polaribacter porphyrae]|uniref:Adhesin domain-containing protein n=1 Tax=Polaribacter porphyrae TaxID=1137780 RepID=A0A2S7WPW3_9FLAO|nr:hypothetical protein [Polaribacter porphyrae]PQJ79658.1 hypothetical protein BTO18_10955 [Polaribacter porphyrae]